MPDEDNSVKQTAISGRDSKQVAGNNHETNRNLFIGIFFFAIVALGGLAWAFTIGFNHSEQAPKVEQGSQTP